jgi:Ricin-type beta-trefoil lectin domain-like
MSINYLQSANSGLVIDIDSTGGIANNSPLQAYTKKTEPNQWWTTKDVPGKPGYFWIVSAVDNLVIDINENGGVKSGSALQALVQKSENNQYWTTKNVPGQPGYFWIVSADQNLVIDINENGGVKAGSTLQALVQKNETNQYWKWVTAPVAPPPAALGSNSNYYLYAGLNSSGGDNFIQGIAVIIDITQDLVGTPFSFQLNAYSPKSDLDAWQQYGVSMAPGSNDLNTFAENWPISGNNLFNIEPGSLISLPNQTTIPAGYQITIQLNYSPGSYNVSGATYKVVSAGKTLGVQTISLLGQSLAAGGTITESDLAPIVAYQLNLVGWANKFKSSLSSGAGYINYLSTTPVTALNGRPADAESTYITAETSNSNYSVVPSGSSKSVIQRFGFSSNPAEIVIPNALLHTRISRFKP